MVGIVAAQPVVDVVKREEQRLLARFLVDKVALLNVRPYQFVAPPCIPFVLWLQVAVVIAAKVEVLKGEELFVLCAHWKR